MPIKSLWLIEYERENDKEKIKADKLFVENLYTLKFNTQCLSSEYEIDMSDLD